MKFLNLAFYRFLDLDLLEEHRKILRKKCAETSIKGTILLAREGMNGNLSGEEEQVRTIYDFLKSHFKLHDMVAKESWSSQITYPRMLVKIKKEIIPIGISSVKPHVETGRRISPKKFKQWLDANKDLFILDTRNSYEVELGTFEKAQHLNLRHFRSFPEKLQQVPEDLKNKPMVMFCTGGIRCEKASVIAMQLGFQEVYQLDGGILKYFEECGGAHYQGDCFVFDRRVVVDTRLQEK